MGRLPSIIFILCLGGAVARADTFQVFDVTGSLFMYGVLSGTLTLDTRFPSLQPRTWRWFSLRPTSTFLKRASSSTRSQAPMSSIIWRVFRSYRKFAQFVHCWVDFGNAYTGGKYACWCDSRTCRLLAARHRVVSDRSYVAKSPAPGSARFQKLLKRSRVNATVVLKFYNELRCWIRCSRRD